MIRYPITPCPAPRQVNATAVQAYVTFCDDVKRLGVRIPATPFVVFHIPMPEMWTEKQRARYRMTPHLQSPDIGDLQDGLFEAVFEDAIHVWAVQAQKLWSDTGSILIGELDRTVLVMGSGNA